MFSFGRFVKGLLIRLLLSHKWVYLSSLIGKSPGVGPDVSIDATWE